MGAFKAHGKELIVEVKMNEAMIVTVYADDTGLFTEEECNFNNMVDLVVPGWVVKEWYEKHIDDLKTDTMTELGVSEEDATFDRWVNEVCTCDDFLGFYSFCKKMGIVPATAC